MTSAQLILVSVSSALIAVIAMLVVATVLRARTREGAGNNLSQATGPQTRAQRAATRAQKRAQRATMRADRKAAKAAASVNKSEKKKAAATATAAAKTEPAENVAKDAPGDKRAGEMPEAPSATVAAERSAPPAPPVSNDELVVPGERDDEIATTEAGKRAAEAKPKTRRSLLGRSRSTEDSQENRS